MGKSHLSRLASPTTFGVERKGSKWIARPLPGPHSFDGCLTLSCVLRDKLGYAKTKKEITKILTDKNVLVDKIVRREYKFPVGFMDIIELPKLGEVYRITYDTKGRLVPVKIDTKESNLKILKIINKTMVQGGKLQINFYDGKNALLDKLNCKVGDSVLFDLVKKQVVKTLPLENGAEIFITGGKYIGKLGKIKEVQKENKLQRSNILFEIDGQEHITLLEYAFVVGKNKSEVKLEEIK